MSTTKVGNQYILTIKSEAEIDGKMKYWVDGFANMCIDDNVLDKLKLYHEVPEDEKGADVGDIITLGDNGVAKYKVSGVDNSGSKPVLHIINLNNGFVQTHAGKYHIVEKYEEPFRF